MLVLFDDVFIERFLQFSMFVEKLNEDELPNLADMARRLGYADIGSAIDFRYAKQRWPSESEWIEARRATDDKSGGSFEITIGIGGFNLAISAGF